MAGNREIPEHASGVDIESYPDRKTSQLRSEKSEIVSDGALADPSNAAILRFRVLHGLDYKDIATLTGLSWIAVRGRYARLKNSLPNGHLLP